jgi:uncharacterized protein YutE (UPF0331/DUF86 family)
MPDLEVVTKHLHAMAGAIAELKRHAPYDEKRLRANLDQLWILERGLYLCIQNILDCFSHIISADLNDQWDSYSEAASILRNRGIINTGQEELLNKMIGLRNRLSHQYLGLSLAVLTDVGNNRLGDITDLANQIARYCNLPFPNGK